MVGNLQQTFCLQKEEAEQQKSAAKRAARNARKKVRKAECRAQLTAAETRTETRTSAALEALKLDDDSNTGNAGILGSSADGSMVGKLPIPDWARCPITKVVTCPIQWEFLHHTVVCFLICLIICITNCRGSPIPTIEFCIRHPL